MGISYICWHFGLENVKSHKYAEKRQFNIGSGVNILLTPLVRDSDMCLLCSSVNSLWSLIEIRS